MGGSLFHPMRMRLAGSRKCLCCKEFFMPDCRNRERQCYCNKPHCCKVSKQVSQRKWRSSDKGQDYEKGTASLERVRNWRARNPEYWKRTRRKRKSALRDSLNSQSIDHQEDIRDFTAPDFVALQDSLKSQNAVIHGVIFHLTGCTLQDSMDATMEKFRLLGESVLGKTIQQSSFG